MKRLLISAPLDEDEVPPDWAAWLGWGVNGLQCWSNQYFCSNVWSIDLPGAQREQESMLPWCNGVCDPKVTFFLTITAPMPACCGNESRARNLGSPPFGPGKGEHGNELTRRCLNANGLSAMNWNDPVDVSGWALSPRTLTTSGSMPCFGLSAKHQRAMACPPWIKTILLMSLVELCLQERSKHLDHCPTSMARLPSIKVAIWLVRHTISKLIFLEGSFFLCNYSKQSYVPHNLL